MDKKWCWGHLSEADDYWRDKFPISSLVWYIRLQSQLEVGLRKGYLAGLNQNIDNNGNKNSHGGS